MSRRRASDDSGKVTADEFFAIVPEWILYANISPQAVRLYAVLHRIANDATSKGFAKRATLARRLRRRSGDTWIGVDVKTVDRATAELEALGAIEVTEQYDTSGDRRENLYKVITRRPANVQIPDTADTSEGQGGGVTDDATPGQRCPDRGVIDVATVASQMSQQGNQSPLTKALEPEQLTVAEQPSPSRTEPEAEDGICVDHRGGQLVAEIAGVLGHPYLVEQLYRPEDAGGRRILGRELTAREAAGWPTVDLVVEVAGGITVDSPVTSMVATLLTRARRLDERPFVATVDSDSPGNHPDPLRSIDAYRTGQLDGARRHGEVLAGAGLPPDLLFAELEHRYANQPGDPLGERFQAALQGAGLLDGHGQPTDLLRLLGGAA